MVEDELITTRFVAFAGANDHPPAAFPTEMSESISWLHSSNYRPVWRRNCTMA